MQLIEAGPTTARGNGKKTDKATTQDGAINITALRSHVKELETLYTRKQDASDDYKNAIDTVATKCGVGKKPLKAFIAARMKDKVRETHAQAEQLSLLFEDIS
jgi:phytoene/squalene synthetase